MNKQEFSLTNSQNEFELSISYEENGEISISSKEINLKKEFKFSASPKDVLTLTKNHSFELSSLEFYNFAIECFKNSKYTIEYDDKKNSLKIVLNIEFIFGDKTHSRKIELFFKCVSYDETERLTSIISDLQIKQKQFSEQSLKQIIQELSSLSNDVIKHHNQISKLEKNFEKDISNGFLPITWEGNPAMNKPFKDDCISIIEEQSWLITPSIKVDKKKNYEFTFWIKQITSKNNKPQEISSSFYDKVKEQYSNTKRQKICCGEWTKITHQIKGEDWKSDFIAPCVGINFECCLKDCFAISKIVLREKN